MKSEISAFVDGELDPDAAGRCLHRLKQDDTLLQAWHDYHLIGDALRGQIGPAIDAGFARRLEAEPTVLAPRPSTVAANSSRWVTALSAAAGVAAFVFVVAAWVALPQAGMEAGSVPLALTTTAPAPVSPQLASVPIAVGVEDYLLAHQRFSPASSMQGVAPYVRTVSAERKGDAR